MGFVPFIVIYASVFLRGYKEIIFVLMERLLVIICLSPIVFSSYWEKGKMTYLLLHISETTNADAEYISNTNHNVKNKN